MATAGSRKRRGIASMRMENKTRRWSKRFAACERRSSRSMGELIRSAREQYDFVILDSAPMLALADSRILATLVSGVLLVVKNAMIPREQVKQALFGIHSVGANVVGVALNRVDLHTNGYFDYHADPDGNGSSGSFLEVDSQGTMQQQR